VLRAWLNLALVKSSLGVQRALRGPKSGVCCRVLPCAPVFGLLAADQGNFCSSEVYSLYTLYSLSFLCN
jgi:hypothetical protein